MEITASILDYIGKYEGGILVSVGIMYNDTYYDSIFYYTVDKMIINVEEKLTDALGHFIEEDEDYYELMRSIINQCEPFEKMVDQLEEIKTEES
jgi:hypothetical protein